MTPLSLSAANDLFAHNYWARDRQLDACAGLTGEQFLQAMGSSFSSIRDTLVHLAGVEWIWLERWRGRSPRGLLDARDFPSLESVAERWRAIESEMRTYLAGLGEADLSASVSYVNLKGQAWSYPLWRMMLHVLQHQGYHRGQVATLLRQHGIVPPQVDFLVWCDTQQP
jgi:uncharacterized damage-inducible protein DinB